MKETLDLVGEADNIEIFTNAKLIENLLPYNSQESHARYSRAIATRFRRLNPYVLPGFLELVKVGVPAKIKLNYSPEKEFKSSIDYIYPALGSETRTTKVRFTIANPGEKIKPNMYTDVEIKISLGSKLSIHDQRRIIAELDALQLEVNMLKSLQSGTAAELDALLPAILDRAFKGEL